MSRVSVHHRTAREQQEPVFDFRINPDAQPGNLVPALARLLIDFARRRRPRVQVRLVEGQVEPEGKESPS